MKNNTVVYTAVFGGKDIIHDPEVVESGVDYVYFTDDRNLRSKVFKVVYVDPLFEDPRLSSRIYKLFPHIFLPDYEQSLWIDGLIKLKSKTWNIFEEKLKKSNFVGFAHPIRNCIYEEVEACIELGKGRYSDLMGQVMAYKKDGFPAHFGLLESTIIARNTFNTELIEFEHLWWKEIRTKSFRDQLSFPYILWKTGFKVEILEKPIREWKNFEIMIHKK